MKQSNRPNRSRSTGSNQNNGVKRVVVVTEKLRLDRRMKELSVMCRRLSEHPVPVPMKFIAEATSHSGQPMAVYACTFHGCRCRQGWVRDRSSARPIQLWEGMHKS